MALGAALTASSPLRTEATMIVAFALATVLGLLSALHVYWACGGRWGWTVAIPERDGRVAFSPSSAVSLGVATALGVAAALALGRGGMLSLPAPSWLSQAFAVGGALVFLARAIGDFKLVGFCKRVRGTRFAMWDSLCYSPLCLALAVGFARLALH
jgi:Protein of unknown function (DUF3995)